VADHTTPDEPSAAVQRVLNHLADAEHESLCNCRAYPDNCLSNSRYTRDMLIAGLGRAEDALDEAVRQGWLPPADTTTDTTGTADSVDTLIAEYAAKAKEIYDAQTAGDHTWTGVLAAFAMALAPHFADRPVCPCVTNDDYVHPADLDTASPDRPANTPTDDLRGRARKAVEDALSVDLTPLLDAEAITVSASMTEDAADAVIRLARYAQAEECVRDLLSAVYPGDPMPDRPLDTIWAHLLDQVRNRTSQLDESRAENAALKAKPDAAYQHIGEQALIDMDEPIPPYGSTERDTRVAALRGEQK
jgi:hypothetical protein